MKKLFVLIQTVLFVWYNWLDFNTGDSTYIKYCLVILCFLFALLGKNKLIKIGLCITVIADYFLLVTMKEYEVGIMCFCVVQTIYMIMIGKKKTLWYRLTCFFVLVMVLVLVNMVSIQNVLALYSIVFLSFNCLESFHKSKLLFIGLVLFWLCDISVGLYNIGIYEEYTVYMMWLFYGPSQVILSLYGGKDAKE